MNKETILGCIIGLSTGIAILTKGLIPYWCTLLICLPLWLFIGFLVLVMGHLISAFFYGVIMCIIDNIEDDRNQ